MLPRDWSDLKEPREEEDALSSAAFGHIDVGMALVSLEGEWLKVNRAFGALTGCSEDEILGGIPTRADDLKPGLAEMRQLLGDNERTGIEVEKRCRGRDGHTMLVSLGVSLVRAKDGVPWFYLLQVRGTGEPGRGTEPLIREKILLDSLMNTSPDHIYFKDRQSRIVRINLRMAKDLRFDDPAQAIGLTDFDFFDEDHARQAYDDEQQIMATGEIVLNKEEKEVWSDGRVTWVSSTKVPHRNEQGEIIGIIGISREITQQKLTEEKMRHDEERYRTLIKATSAMVWGTGPSGTFETPQPAWTAFTGQSFEQLQGWGWLDAVHPDDRTLTVKTWSEALANRSTYLVRHRLLRHDGEYRHLSVRAVPLLGEGGEVVEWVGFHTDITERVLAEAEKDRLNDQLVDLSHRAGMSEVATSVLHNVGNVLNSVNISCTVVAEKVRHSRIGNVTKVAALLKERGDDLPAFLTTDPQGRQLPDFLAKLSDRLVAEQAEVLGEIELLDRNIEHISQIISVQQSYANIGGVQESLPVERLVEDALRMNTGAMSRHEITLIRDFAQLPPMLVEKHKVLQILVNLIRNAKHALTDGNPPEKRLVVRIAMKDADRVAISVIDNGIGIAREDMHRIFAHGFTTKPDGHGFGLHSGVLAAREMGGALTAHSDGLGTGATFTLELPFRTDGSAPQS
jgi:PAS domain S-box-containing protein